MHPEPSRPAQPYAAQGSGRCDLPLGCAMIVARNRAAYVGPFDRICRGLRFFEPATTDSKEASSVYQNRRTPGSAPAQLAGNGVAEAASSPPRGPRGAPRRGTFEPATRRCGAPRKALPWRRFETASGTCWMRRGNGMERRLIRPPHRQGPRWGPRGTLGPWHAPSTSRPPLSPKHLRPHAEGAGAGLAESSGGDRPWTARGHMGKPPRSSSPKRSGPRAARSATCQGTCSAPSAGGACPSSTGGAPARDAARPSDACSAASATP